jgi:molybdenum cofactor guanylyltransferase
MSEDPRSPAGLILAGGLGRRMGGRNKGWIPWRGRPLVQAVLERLRPQVGPIAISSNTLVDRYRRLGFPVLRDRHRDFRGPLAGVAAGLVWAHGRRLLCVPVDAPNLPLDLGARLWRALDASGSTVAIAHDGERLQPLFALLRPGVAAALARDLAAGPLPAGAWLQAQPHCVVDFSDCPDAFANLNRPEDLLRG